MPTLRWQIQRGQNEIQFYVVNETLSRLLEKLSKFCHPLVPWAPNEMRSDGSGKLQYVLVAQMVLRLTKVSAHLFYKIEGYTQTLTVWPPFCIPLRYRKVLHLFGILQSLW